jgi:hypothetical protein
MGKAQQKSPIRQERHSTNSNCKINANQKEIAGTTKAKEDESIQLICLLEYRLHLKSSEFIDTSSVYIAGFKGILNPCPF